MCRLFLILGKKKKKKSHKKEKPAVRAKRPPTHPSSYVKVWICYWLSNSFLLGPLCRPSVQQIFPGMDSMATQKELIVGVRTSNTHQWHQQNKKVNIMDPNPSNSYKTKKTFTGFYTEVNSKKVIIMRSSFNLSVQLRNRSFRINFRFSMRMTTSQK